MSADDWNLRGLSSDFLHELVGTNNVQCSDANNLLGVKPSLLPEFRHGWHNGVYWVDDEGHHSIRTIFCACLDCTLCDVCIDGQKVLAVLARLARDASWHKDKVATSKSISSFVNGFVFVQGQDRRCHFALALDV